MYILVSTTGDADDTIPKYANPNFTYRGNDGFGASYPSGTRVSYALYSVMQDGSKSVQKVTVITP